jgi:hypothetical protein
MRGITGIVALQLFMFGLTGCGRSSLWGSGGGDCPPGGHCIGGSTDLAHGSGDMHPTDMKPGDLAGNSDMPGGECGKTIPCSDPKCEGKPQCITPGQEICNNGIDDNDNGLIDCADPQCFNDPFCLHQDGGTGDMAVDCFDGNGNPRCDLPECITMPGCLHQTCQPEIEFGMVTPQNFDQSRTFDTRGATTEYRTCAFPGGTARVGEFTLTATADVRLDFAQPTGSAHVVTVNRAGFGQLCDQNEILCLQANQQPSATHTFAQLSPGTYYVIVQSFPGTQGATTVRISTSKMPENQYPNGCSNGIDDDGNGLIDCADGSCLNDPSCVNQECKPDRNLGALIVGAPPVTADFDTRTSSNRFHPTCAGTSTGKDYVVRFTLHETAGVLVDWTQGAGSNHVISIFHTPPPGQACDGAGQMSCFYPGGSSGGEVAFSPRPPGDYIFIFKSISPETSGPMHISVSAFANRQMEICNNGIDDDGNGLTDCADPACFGVDGCKPPICIPDVDLGQFSWGTTKMTTVDTASGNNYYNARCAQGGGKNRVVRVQLTQPMGLGYACSETGSHVLQLAQRIQPLDACDANPVNCADPSVLPFGCNFIMPNLQPGTYELLVDAFAAGKEGTVNLTLFGVEEKVIEICDNGIDDDNNGLTDCKDPACFTSPLCQKFTCKPDRQLGLLPLDGTPTSTTVQTSGNGDNFRNSCSSQTGGQDADVDFTLPARTNLKIEWAQVGNHTFELYPNVNDSASCDAGTPINCTPSGGAQTGSYTLNNVPGGKYHLVVDADRPGSEGGAVLQVSGTAAQ